MDYLTKWGKTRSVRSILALARRAANSICCVAAQGGHLNVVQWAMDLQHHCWNNETWKAAADSGHVHIMRWALSEGIPPHEDACTGAAWNGRLEVLKWCHAKQFPWNYRTCDVASFKGHIHVLKWTQSQNCPYDNGICLTAVLGNQLETLQWLRKNGYAWDENEIRRSALLLKRVGIVKWIDATTSS